MNNFFKIYLHIWCHVETEVRSIHPNTNKHSSYTTAIFLLLHFPDTHLHLDFANRNVIYWVRGGKGAILDLLFHNFVTKRGRHRETVLCTEQVYTCHPLQELFQLHSQLSAADSCHERQCEGVPSSRLDFGSKSFIFNINSRSRWAIELHRRLSYQWWWARRLTGQEMPNSSAGTCDIFSEAIVCFI